MVKYYFDKAKKEYFLQFWSIKNIGDFEKLDSLSFAFRFSQLYQKCPNQKKRGEVFSCIEYLLSDCQQKGLLEVNENRLCFTAKKPFLLPLSQNNHIVKTLDSLNITLSTLEHTQISNHSDNKISWTKPFVHFLSQHRLLRKKEEIAQNCLEYSPKITFKQKNTAKLYKKLCAHQGIALLALDEKLYKSAVEELIQHDLAELVVLGLGAMPGLLLKKGEKESKSVKNVKSTKTQKSSEKLEGAKSSGKLEKLENPKNPKESAQALEDQLLLASSYLKRRFIHYLLTIEQFFYQKAMLVTPSCPFLSANEKNQKVFLEKKVWAKWRRLLKEQKKSFKNLDFHEKVEYFIAAGLSRNKPIFRAIQQWFCLHYPNKNESEVVFSVTKKELLAQINRQRFLQCRRPFRESSLSKTLKQLKCLGVITSKKNRYIFLKEVFLPPEKNDLKMLSIDSDITISAYTQEISLEDIHFLSLFCQATYTEHIIEFTPTPSLAAFAWYSDLTPNKIIDKLQTLEKDDFSPKIKQYFSVYFEHAKAAKLNKTSSISFASRGFFMTAKHIAEKLLEEHPEHKEFFLSLQDQKCFIFFNEATKKLILDGLAEKNFIQNKNKKNQSSKKSCE